MFDDVVHDVMDAVASETGSGGGSDVAPRARVILVGRTGLDAALRLDQSIDLRRVRTAIEAIGELSDPEDTAVDEPVAVVVGADADPGPRAASFVDGLRLINPDVRVLLAGASARPPFDGTVSTERPAQQIRALLRTGGTPAAAPTPAPSPAPPAAQQPLERPAPAPLPPLAEPAPQPSVAMDSSPAAYSAAEPEDLPLIEAMLAGRDILLPAMALIRRRTGAADAVFVPADAPASDGAPAVGSPHPDAVQVPVAHRSRTFGWLSARRAAAADLASHAAWLGHWLALREQQEQLRRAAFTDDLTGAYNRRYFDRFLTSAIEAARAERLPVTVLFFDIDDFKQYNDRYGHAAGDEILRETVRLLSSVIRPSDRVCRIGGDEFVVVFQDPTGPRDPASKPPASIAEIARRFQQQICEHRFPKLAEQARDTLTISGGLATFPWDGDTPEKLLQRADELAIQSKRQGKNAITLGPGAERICNAP